MKAEKVSPQVVESADWLASLHHKEAAEILHKGRLAAYRPDLHDALIEEVADRFARKSKYFDRARWVYACKEGVRAAELLVR